MSSVCSPFEIAQHNLEMTKQSALVAPRSSLTSGHDATPFAVESAGRHDSVDDVGTLAPSMQDPAAMHQRKGMAALPPTPYDDPSRTSLITPAEGHAFNGGPMVSEERENSQLIMQPYIELSELNTSMLDWEEQFEDTRIVHRPHQAPCTFPIPLRDPFESPPPIARLVQEVYIGHSPSPLLIPMQFSELPFEHGRIYPFGQRQPQHEFVESYVFGTTGQEEEYLPDHPEEPPFGSRPAVGMEASQEMHGMNLDDSDRSSSVKAAESLLTLRTAGLFDYVKYSSAPRTFHSLQGTQRPANRQCDNPPPTTSLPSRSSRLPATRLMRTQINCGSFSNTEAVVMPKLTTNELARMMDLPTPADYAEARRALPAFSNSRGRRRTIGMGHVQSAGIFRPRMTYERRSVSNVLKLPGLVSSSDFILSHLMPAKEETPEPQMSPPQDHEDEAVPRFVPTMHPGLFDAEPEDVSDTQEFMTLVCRLINFGRGASRLLNAQNVPIAKIPGLQQEAAILAMATQLFQESLDAQHYTLGAIEGNAVLDAMMEELIATEETTRNIASLKSTRGHDFMEPLEKLTRQTTVLAHRMLDL